MEKAFDSIVLILTEGIVLAILILHFISPARVIGCSMYPHLEELDYLVCNEGAYIIGEPEYGDIIIFKKDKHYIKRVIGKPGDTIVIKGGKVYRNGSRIEDYVADGVITGPEMTVELDQDEYFVLGDNRECSTDSREEDFGTVKKDEIVAKAVFRICPNPGWLY